MDTWQLRCPRGHVDVKRRGNKLNGATDGERYWYCDTCQERYAVARDAKTGREVPA